MLVKILISTVLKITTEVLNSHKLYNFYDFTKVLFLYPRKHYVFVKIGSQMTAHPSHGCRDFTRLFL